MKKPMLCAVILFIAVESKAQLIADRASISSGGTAAALNASYTFQSTVGEAVVQTIQNGDLLLTQGFQQPEPLIQQVAIPFNIKVYPNPAVDQVKIAFYLDAPAWIRFVLINNAGQIIRDLPGTWYPSGFQEVPFDVQVPAGLYLLSFYLGADVITRKIIIK
ncbi:MAG: hypothetical protein RI924_459 [Bacteroidota bacterium]|jgi:hypothetical protein